MNHSPSADRNKQPIADVLSQHPPFSTPDSPGCVLEIGSGTGQHTEQWAKSFPHLTFQPSEYGGGSASPESERHESLKPVFDSIKAYTAELPNVLEPIEVDSASTWGVAPESMTGIIMCNVLHIAPYSVSEGLFPGAAAALVPGGGLFVYGPFMVDGEHTAPSNEAFDVRLRDQNPEWGVRDSSVLALLAKEHQLELTERIQMPANNFILLFRKAA
eukprot:TRINITY_DN5532_c0_g1_i1.p1 TRINITY_DN5532_c0_g1~~TRINITY_DN5532_c0_g1_i1.p1  ORF type:complete len:216 (-),score=36.19 TRINITY_DN5532_c0_g1_i1:155-802(-)